MWLSFFSTFWLEFIKQIKMEQKIKYLILNSNEPLIFKNILDWELLKWSLEDWKTILKDEELQFRCGKNSFTQEPQWERTTNNVKATFSHFLSFIKNKNKEWMYFDYKYLKEWFNNINELKKHIKWNLFGFPQITSEDCTIWIGSEGAHTPCHMDTYGCNLVAQVHGRKQWLLFPPEENLKPTRIPYEESSIYSKINFFSPALKGFEDVKNCRKIILEPGDVLFVPHKWWHYVENLDTAISVNVWLPLPEDDNQRLEESLVQFFVTQITNNANEKMKNIILNPNSENDIESMTLNASLNLINSCRNICNECNKKDKLEDKLDINYDLSEIFDQYTFLQKIPELSMEEFYVFLENQRKRFGEQPSIEKNCDFQEVVDLVNAFTHPDVISLIKNKLLEQ